MLFLKKEFMQTLFLTDILFLCCVFDSELPDVVLK